MKRYLQKVSSPDISKMWSAFFVLSRSKEILRFHKKLENSRFIKIIKI